MRWSGNARRGTGGDPARVRLPRGLRQVRAGKTAGDSIRRLTISQLVLCSRAPDGKRAHEQATVSTSPLHSIAAQDARARGGTQHHTIPAVYDRSDKAL